ncbi:helix-turn-helix transcriptional regulator [Ligilactobacillus faecis]|uniref:Helix-turn-helix transcriptional regulator n=1 Tax=Ligilactobacillus faecis TaxID=762833 RepID=A0ABV4DUE3_9LACO
MPVKDFSNIYNKYIDTPEKKVYADQIDEQLKASVLLRELREREGYSQRELAKKVGKPQSTIARIENGSMNVTFDTIAEIVNSLGHTIRFEIL